jgi:hypothetical protein
VVRQAALWFPECFNTGHIVHTLIRQRRELDDLVNNPDGSIDIDSLCKSVMTHLGTLRTAISDCSSLWWYKTTDEPQIILLLQQMTYQMSLGYNSCLVAMNGLKGSIPGRRRIGEIVYHLVGFFENTLKHLHSSSSQQAAYEKSDGGEEVHRNKRARIESEYAANNLLCRVLVSIGRTEWKVGQAGHSELLQGIHYHILRHTGSLLSVAVFEEHVALSEIPKTIPSGTSPTEVTMLECRYIIPILQAVLGECSERQELIAQVLLGNDSKSSSTVNNYLLSKTKRFIRDTLLESAIGGDALECFKLPSQPEHSELQVPPELVEFGPKWFVHWVWQLASWDDL